MIGQPGDGAASDAAADTRPCALALRRPWHSRRRSSLTVLMLAALWIPLAGATTGCALKVESEPPAPGAVDRLGCVAVLPFESYVQTPQAGDMIAELVSSALVLSDRYNIVEPAEVRGILDARGIPFKPSSDGARMRATGEALGVEAVFSGAVSAYTTSAPSDRPTPVAFSVSLLDVRSGSIVWTGQVRYDESDRSMRQPVLAGLAQASADALIEVVAEDRRAGTMRQSCARPKAPVLEAKKIQHEAPAPTPVSTLAQYLDAPEAERPALASAIMAPPPGTPSGGDNTGAAAGSTGAARSWNDGGSGAALAGMPAAAGPAEHNTVVADASGLGRADQAAGASPLPDAGLGDTLPALPDLPGLPPGPDAGAGGSTSANALPPLPGMPSGNGGGGDAFPALPGMPPAAGGNGTAGGDALPALPGLPDLPPSSNGQPSGMPPAGGPSGSSADALPALQDLPGMPAGDALPGLPPGPDAGQGGAGLPALPGLPDFSNAGADAGKDEYANLPYSPAAPDRPPKVNARLTGRQRSLLRQLFVGTGVTQRWFRKAALRSNGKNALADLATLMKAIPDLKIAIEVHADLGTVPGRSQQLSDQQQAAVQKLVWARYPFTKGRLFFRSLGNTKPLAKDVNARARMQNTRVEIRRVY